MTTNRSLPFSFHSQAKTKLANVYLHQKKDRITFAQCFRELVDNLPGPESYLMLGDAYMSIQGKKSTLRQDFGSFSFPIASTQNPMRPSMHSKWPSDKIQTIRCWRANWAEHMSKHINTPKRSTTTRRRR